MDKYLFGSVSYALAGGMSLVVLAFAMAFLHARKSGEWERMAQAVLAERANPPKRASPRSPRMTGASDDHHARRHRRLQRAGRRDLRRRPCHHARHHLVGRQAQSQRDRLLHGRARRGRRLQRHRHRGRLPVGLDLPRLRGPHVPLRLRRLDHRPGGDALVPAGALPARRPDAQRRQVHGGRRAQLPAAPAPGADRRGHQHAAHLRHLPHRPARGRGLAHRGPGRDQLRARRPHLRDLHGRLRRLRRHARHDVGADHQGRDAR